MDVSASSSATSNRLSSTARLSLTSENIGPSFPEVSSLAQPSAVDDSDSDSETASKPIQGPMHDSALPVTVPFPSSKKNPISKSKKSAAEKTSTEKKDKTPKDEEPEYALEECKEFLRLRGSQKMKDKFIQNINPYKLKLYWQNIAMEMRKVNAKWPERTDKSLSQKWRNLKERVTFVLLLRNL
jgi:hypothetical protein